MGPAGILIAFQIVTAAVTFFAQQSNKVKKAAGETSQAFREEAAAIELVTMELAKGNLTLEERLDILERYGIINKQTKEDLKEIGLSEEQQNLILEKRNELQSKNLALEEARKAQKEGKTLAQLEIEGLRELRNLETNIEEERKRRLDELAVLAEKYGTDEATVAKTRRIINEQADQKILQNAEAIRLANAKIEAASRGVLGLKSDIFDIESDINSVISDRIDEQEKLLATEKARKDAIDELISAQIQQQESLLEDAVLEEDVVKFKKHFSRLLELKKLQLSEQKKEELKGVKDKETINAIEDKYRILFDTINNEFKDKFKEGIEGIVNTKLVLKRKDKISFEDLINPPDTASQKWAREQVNKVADAAADELQKRVKQTPALNGEGEGAFDFAKAFGMSKERLDATLELAKTAVSSISDILSAQAEKEIAIETNKTNALNDQLRARLANEQLSANERDKINQQIARNEAKLVAKENEINKKRFEQEKAARISMAIIDTFSAATSVLATTKKGAFERIAGMIAVTVAGLANVVAISKQQFIGKALPNPSLSAQGDTGGSTGPSFNVVGTSGQNQLAAAIEGLRNDPLRAYVVSSDVTTAQELERKIVEGASI